MSDLTPRDLAAIDAYARSVAHVKTNQTPPLFNAWARGREWWGTPLWVPARARFRQTHKQARAAMWERVADRAARNEWRAA